MARIYTSYFANWRNFPEGSIVIGITRFPPEGMNYQNIAGLAPSAELLQKIKSKQIDEYMFKIVYLTELVDRGYAPKKVRQVLDSIG